VVAMTAATSNNNNLSQEEGALVLSILGDRHEGVGDAKMAISDLLGTVEIDCLGRSQAVEILGLPGLWDGSQRPRL